MRQPAQVRENWGASEEQAQHEWLGYLKTHVKIKISLRLTPAALKDLQTGYAEQITPLQQQSAEALALEHKLSDLTNIAYNLTAEEIALLWETAPPRIPLWPPNSTVHQT